MMRAIIIFLFVVFSFTLAAQNKAEKLIPKIDEAEAKGDYQTALKYANALVKSDPENAFGYAIRGKIYTKLMEADLATKDLDKALRLEPCCEVYYYRAYCFSVMGKSDKAIADANKAIQICGENSDYMQSIYINRGSARMKKMDYNGAYEDYMMAYRLDSNYFETLFGLGSVCDEIGKDSMALVYLTKAYQIDSTNSDLINNIGFFYQDHGQYEKSAVYMKRALQLNKENPLAWNNLGYCKYKLGDYNGAMSDINHSIKLYPQNSYAWRNRALVYLALNNTTAACADLEKAMTLGYTSQYGYDVQELYNKHCK